MVRFFSRTVTVSPFLKRPFGLYFWEQMGSADPPRKKLVVTLNISTCISLPKLPTDIYLYYHPFWVLLSRFSPLHSVPAWGCKISLFFESKWEHEFTVLLYLGIEYLEWGFFRSCYFRNATLRIRNAIFAWSWRERCTCAGTRSLSTESKKQSFKWIELILKPLTT